MELVLQSKLDTLLAKYIIRSWWETLEIDNENSDITETNRDETFKLENELYITFC